MRIASLEFGLKRNKHITYYILHVDAVVEGTHVPQSTDNEKRY
jgi:hypothetical protein